MAERPVVLPPSNKGEVTQTCPIDARKIELNWERRRFQAGACQNAWQALSSLQGLFLDRSYSTIAVATALFGDIGCAAVVIRGLRRFVSLIKLPTTRRLPRVG
jgi:hypothetical protein